jgi:hypothetical protein
MRSIREQEPDVRSHGIMTFKILMGGKIGKCIWVSLLEAKTEESIIVGLSVYYPEFDHIHIEAMNVRYVYYLDSVVLILGFACP